MSIRVGSCILSNSKEDDTKAWQRLNCRMNSVYFRPPRRRIILSAVTDRVTPLTVYLSFQIQFLKTQSTSESSEGAPSTSSSTDVVSCSIKHHHHHNSPVPKTNIPSSPCPCVTLWLCLHLSFSLFLCVSLCLSVFASLSLYFFALSLSGFCIIHVDCTSILSCSQTGDRNWI